MILVHNKATVKATLNFKTYRSFVYNYVKHFIKLENEFFHTNTHHHLSSKPTLVYQLKNSNRLGIEILKYSTE